MGKKIAQLPFKDKREDSVIACSNEVIFVNKYQMAKISLRNIYLNMYISLMEFLIRVFLQSLDLFIHWG